MKKLFSLLDFEDAQLVSGISMLGYGLYLVYPPAMFIIIGLLILFPLLLPPLLSIWRAK
jgi:hypothetical protein